VLHFLKYYIALCFYSAPLFRPLTQSLTHSLTHSLPIISYHIICNIFTTVSSLNDDHPAKKLAKLSGANFDVLLAAFTSTSNGFPPTNEKGRWTDANCREVENYLSPPTLSILGSTVLTRSREPNLPPPQTHDDDNKSMGEVLDTWMRTKKGSDNGIIFYKDSDKKSIQLASNKSWNSGSINMHIFPRVDWFDARVPVGSRINSNISFKSNTNQNGPGNPNENGGNFKIGKYSKVF
jgi:hypothetical protein